MRSWRRRSGRGDHQLRSPISVIVAGTSSVRTTVASTRTATAMPMPSCLISTSSPAAKPANTMTIRAAADVMIPPVRSRPAGDRQVVVARRRATPPRCGRAGRPRSPSTGRRRTGTRSAAWSRRALPTASKPSRPDRWPSWNTHTSTPNVAPSDSTFITTALTATTTEPVIRNSSDHRRQPDEAEGQGQAGRDRRREVDELGGVAGDERLERRRRRRAASPTSACAASPCAGPSATTSTTTAPAGASVRSTSTRGHAVEAADRRRRRRRVPGRPGRSWRATSIGSAPTTGKRVAHLLELARLRRRRQRAGVGVLEAGVQERAAPATTRAVPTTT